ncbi:MAG: hypothetical protein ACP5T7_05265, partial [bacterium]
VQRIKIYLNHEPDIPVRCPECGEFYGMYDHAPERKILWDRVAFLTTVQCVAMIITLSLVITKESTVS